MTVKFKRSNTILKRICDKKNSCTPAIKFCCLFFNILMTSRKNTSELSSPFEKLFHSRRWNPGLQESRLRQHWQRLTLKMMSTKVSTMMLSFAKTSNAKLRMKHHQNTRKNTKAIQVILCSKSWCDEWQDWSYLDNFILFMLGKTSQRMWQRILNDLFSPLTLCMIV